MKSRLKLIQHIKQKLFFMPLITLVASLYASYSYAIIPIVYDPYDVFQNTITAKNSIQSLLNQIKQLECDLANLKKYAKGKPDNTQAYLLQLADLVSDGESLSYSVQHLDEAFDRKFPGFKSSQNYPSEFSSRSNTVRSTLKSSLRGLAFQGELFKHEKGTIDELQALSDNASGNLEAHQTSHRIALQQISQMQKLRQVMLNHASSQNTYLAYRIQKEQTDQATLQAWVKNSQVAFKPYDDNQGFGASEIPQLP